MTERLNLDILRGCRMGKDNCYSGLALDIQRIGLENKALFNKKFLLKGL